MNGQEVSLETDGKGNVTGTVQMTKADSGDSGSATKQESGRQSSAGKDTGANVVSDQAMLNNPLQNRTAVNETGFTQSTTAYTSNTQEIMDQILTSGSGLHRMWIPLKCSFIRRVLEPFTCSLRTMQERLPQCSMYRMKP